MGNNNSGLLLLLFLLLAFVLAVPLLFLLLHYNAVALPSLSSNSIAIAAAAGLFVIPVLFLFLAIIALAGKTRRAGPARVRYPWEAAFPEVAKEHELPGAEVSRARAAGKNPNFGVTAAGAPVPSAFGIKAVFAVVIVLLLLASLVFLSQRLSSPFDSGSNETKANATAEKKTGNSTLPSSSALQNIAAPAKNQGINLAGWFRSLAASFARFAHLIQDLPAKLWQSIAAAALVVVLVVALFYSSKAGQLSEAGEWFGGIVGWIGDIPAAIGRNFAKIIMPTILLVAAVFLAAGYFFRKWLGANLPGFAFVAGILADFLSRARDFILLYKLYIVIGVFALVAVVGFLVAADRRGNGSKQQANLEKQLKNSAPVASKKAGSK